jgi:hypothetical protein
LSILYEDIFDAAHADRNGLVFLRSVSDDVDAGPLEASFRATRADIEALDLTHSLTRNNCNSVITTLLLQVGIDLPNAVPQSSAALLAAPIPCTDRHLGPENLKTLLLARLPAEPNGQDLLALFDRLKVRSVRQGDMIQGRVPARGRFSLTPAFWSITERVDPHGPSHFAERPVSIEYLN